VKLKPQDVLVAVKLALAQRQTYQQLAGTLGMSLSEVHAAVKRASEAGLVGPDRTANRTAVLDFILMGLRQAFPPKRGALTRGMPTAHGGPPLKDLLSEDLGPPPVWPDPEGTVRGESFSPLYRSAPRAARKDPRLYETLCLIDAVRGGRTRDRELAEQKLRALLLGDAAQPSESRRVRLMIDTERRQGIKRGLEKIGPGPASFYRTALQILTMDPPLEAASHLVGHLAREIESAISDVLDEVKPVGDDQAKVASEADESHREVVLSILKAFAVPMDGSSARAWLGTIGKLHKHAHRDSLNLPRTPGPEFIRFWEGFEEFLAGALDVLDKTYVHVLDRIDRLLQKAAPTKDDAKILRGLIPQGGPALEYFFGKLNDPRWLPLLEAKGFFSTAPAPIENAEGASHPDWPALHYLARMAAIEPRAVSRIALAVPVTDNRVARRTLVKVALALPPDLAAAFVDTADAWLDEASGNADDLLVDRLTAMAENLVAGGETAAALKLIRSLLRPATRHVGEPPHGSKAVSRLNSWGLERALEALKPTIITLGLSAIRILGDLLEEVAVHERPYSRDRWDDGSWIWRREIDERNLHGQDLQNHLVSVLRDAAIGLAGAQPVLLADILACLEQRKWTIFRRLALYVAAHLHAHAPDLAAARLLDRATFAAHQFEREYCDLARVAYSRLSPAEQATILEWIEAGPEIPKGDAGHRQQLVDGWTHRRLAAISDALPAPWQARLTALTAAYGDPTSEDDFPVRIVGGPHSPFQVEDLLPLTPAALVDAAMAWSPPAEWGSPDPSGLARTIATVVEKRAADYAAEAGLLRKLNSTYLWGALRGFTAAARHAAGFAWAPVVDLCAWASVEPPRAAAGSRFEAPAEADASETRKAVLELLSVGMAGKEGRIPLELQRTVWQAIAPALDDQQGATTDPEDDPVSAAINRARSIGVQTAIAYAVWICGPEGTPPTFPEEVRTALDAKAAEPFDAVQAVLGMQVSVLAYLDESWLQTNVRRLFASGRSVAWDSYLDHGRLTLEVFHALRWRYREAVDELRPDITTTRRQQELIESLGDHLMRLYWHGHLQLRERDDLLGVFIANAPEAALANFVQRVGNGLREEPPPTENVLARLKTLWSRCAERDSDLVQSAFGPWFAAGRFDEDWALASLEKALARHIVPRDVQGVVGRLATVSPRRTIRVLSCLELLVQADNLGWGIFLWRAPARTIIANALRSTETELVESARRVVSRLASAGYIEFRDLLPEAGDTETLAI
jgi:hypothetical protein